MIGQTSQTVEIKARNLMKDSLNFPKQSFWQIRLTKKMMDSERLEKQKRKLRRKNRMDLAISETRETIVRKRKVMMKDGQPDLMSRLHKLKNR